MRLVLQHAEKVLKLWRTSTLTLPTIVCFNLKYSYPPPSKNPKVSLKMAKNLFRIAEHLQLNFDFPMSFFKIRFQCAEGCWAEIKKKKCYYFFFSFFLQHSDATSHWMNEFFPLQPRDSFRDSPIDWFLHWPITYLAPVTNVSIGMAKWSHPVLITRQTGEGWS